MKSVLVTGATGLVGRHAIAPLIGRGYEVHGVRHRSHGDSSPTDNSMIWHHADLLNERDRIRLLAACRPTHLLHLAWVTEHGRYWESPDNDRWLEASLDLLRRFDEGGGTRVVVAGTCAEYDWSATSLREGNCIEGVTPCAPRTLYGRKKQELSTWLAQHETLRSAWGRLFYLYGEGEDQRRVIPSVITSLLTRQEARMGPATQHCDFLDSRDAGAAFAALMDSDVTGPVNVASGVPVTLTAAVTLLGEMLGQPRLISIGALPPRPDEPVRLVADVTRLREEVGFQPRYELSSGLRHAVDWWSARLSASSPKEDVARE